MINLVNSKMRRAGPTAYYYSGQQPNVSLENRAKEVVFRGRFSSETGQRNSDISLTVGPKDFAAVLRAMSDADLSAALAAMAAELSYQLADTEVEAKDAA